MNRAYLGLVHQFVAQRRPEVTGVFRHPEFDDHERTVFVHDAESGLRAIIAIHSTALGPAFGGCRMWPYPSDDAALRDVLRLSKGMTAKAAICELPWGGGKAVIIGDPSRDKTDALLLAMGRSVESLAGDYVVADDVGTTLADLAVMRHETIHTAAATAAAQAPLAVTAYGALMAIEATASQVFGRSDLDGLEVAVQGLGNVGMPLCRHLYERGASLIVADLDPARTDDAAERFGARVVDATDIVGVEADLLAPCALGGVLNDDTVPALAVAAVCGAANNQLTAPRHADMIAERGIVFVPDYLVSAGGVIDFHQEKIDDRPVAVLAAVERIRDITNDVLAKAQADAATPLVVADDIVTARLQQAGRERVPAPTIAANARP